jgi:hypothetical protein
LAVDTSQTQSDLEDGQVLDELKKLSEVHLTQIFELQRELARYQAIIYDNQVPSSLIKLLKQGCEKQGSKHGVNLKDMKDHELFPQSKEKKKMKNPNYGDLDLDYEPANSVLIDVSHRGYNSNPGFDIEDSQVFTSTLTRRLHHQQMQKRKKSLQKKDNAFAS